MFEYEIYCREGNPRSYACGHYVRLGIQAVMVEARSPHFKNRQILSGGGFTKVVINNEVPDQRFKELFEELNNLICEKSYSDERKTYDHRFDLHSLVDDIRELKKCDCVYRKKK